MQIFIVHFFNRTEPILIATHIITLFLFSSDEFPWLKNKNKIIKNLLNYVFFAMFFLIKTSFIKNKKNKNKNKKNENSMF